jgi:hypothetical protein
MSVLKSHGRGYYIIREKRLYRGLRGMFWKWLVWAGERRYLDGTTYRYQCGYSDCLKDCIQ